DCDLPPSTAFRPGVSSISIELAGNGSVAKALKRTVTSAPTASEAEVVVPPASKEKNVEPSKETWIGPGLPGAVSTGVATVAPALISGIISPNWPSDSEAT